MRSRDGKEIDADEVNVDTRQSVDDWYYDEFVRLERKDSFASPTLKKIVIISTARSGSTHFCETLAKTGRFGEPSEWMNPRRIQAYGRLHKLQKINVSQYLKYIESKTTTSNGVFSLKLPIGQFAHWELQGLNLLSLDFNKIIYLFRRDKIAQAYSYAKAMATDQWRSAFKPKVHIDPAEIPNSSIADALLKLSQWDEIYMRKIAQHVHLTLCYEDIIARSEVFVEVLGECGIDTSGIDVCSSGIEVQRGEEDLKRVAAFKTYLGC